jgi:branched-chain amino acid transport system ATP-binding protein
MALLEGRKICKSFGGVQALSQVDFAVEPATIVGLIGPNGAGKTSLFNVVAGAFKPTSGKVVFDGQDVTGLPANAICRMGMARTFQVARPFGAMTCLENVMVAAISRHPRKPRPSSRASPGKLSLARTGRNGGLRSPPAQRGSKKRLEMARALATEPKLLMLDEVLGGLNTRRSA